MYVTDGDQITDTCPACKAERQVWLNDSQFGDVIATCGTCWNDWTWHRPDVRDLLREAHRGF